MNIQATD